MPKTFFSETIDPAESKEFSVTVIPPHGTRVKLCATVFNTDGLSSEGCSESWKWDARPPTVTNMSVLLPGVGDYFGSPFIPCNMSNGTKFVNGKPEEMVGFHKCKEVLPINSTNDLAFKVVVNEVPAGDVIAEVRWGVSQELLTEPDDTFEEVGDGEKLENPGRKGVPMKLESQNLPRDRFVHNAIVYIHIWMCDAYQNWCVATLSYAHNASQRSLHVLVDCHCSLQPDTFACLRAPAA